MINLAALTLLSNDAAVADEFLQAATPDDVDAQYGMGLIYAEGRGVEQDEVKSFYWLTRAIEQGDNGAAVLRKVVSAGMTEAQYQQALLLLQEHWLLQSKAGRKENRSRKCKQQQDDPQ